MLQEIITLRNYAHLGDAVWEIFVREYTVFKTSSAKELHKITTERVNASFQAEMLHFLEADLTGEELEFARRARNIQIPAGRRSIQKVYRQSTEFEALIGYWYLHDKERLNYFYEKIRSDTEFFK